MLEGRAGFCRRQRAARWSLLGAVAAVMVISWTASAHAAPLGEVQEFPLPAGAVPNGIATGPEGKVWFTEYGAGKIGVINPANPAELAEYPTKTTGSGPFEIAAGPEGDLWFTEFHAGKIGQIDPTSHTIQEFKIPAKIAGEKSRPFGIALGPEGNLWFTVAYTVNGSEPSASFLGEINPSTHVIDEFPTPTPKSFPAGIRAGADGMLWYTEGEAGSGRIGSIDPVTDGTEDFELPAGGQSPGEITLGPEGDLWFTELFASKIGAFNPTAHTFKEVSTLVPGGTPLGITTGRDQNLWFTEIDGGRIGRLQPASGTLDEFTLPSGSGPSGITAGVEGNLWFAENTASRIATIGAGPAVVTMPASQITPGSATLNGTVNPNRVAVQACRFEYGTTPGSYTASVPCSPPPGSGSAPVAVSASLTTLKAGTTYHFRVAATSLGGSDVGAEESFTTASSGPPVNCSDPATHQLTGYQGSARTISGPGSWCYRAAQIATPVTISGGANVLVLGSSVKSTITANGGGALGVCQSRLLSTVTVSHASGFVVIGDPSDDRCAPDTISSGLRLVDNLQAVEVADNTLDAPLVVENNSGSGSFPEDAGAEIEGNTSYSSLACTGNMPISDGGQPNTVYGTRSGQCKAPF